MFALSDFRKAAANDSRLEVIRSRALTLPRYQPVACHSSIGSRLLLVSNEKDEYSLFNVKDVSFEGLDIALLCAESGA